MKLHSSLLFSLLAGFAPAADLYVSDFSTDGVGSTHDTSGDAFEASPIEGENWSIFWASDPASDGSTNSFITSEGLLISDDWGGQGSFETDEIDVSGESTVNIVTLAATRGTAVFNSGAEGFNWYYILDGVQVDAPLQTSDGRLDYTEELDVSAASTLIVGFTFNINGAGDGFEIVSVKVDDGVPTPEISLEFNPATVAENGGTSIVTVNLSVPASSDLVLDLLVDKAAEATVPATVTVLANASSATFQIAGQDDALADGPQLVTLTVTDPNGVFQEAVATFVVSDDEPFAAPDVVLNEIRINANNAFSGNGEYFELKSTTANESLDRVFLVAVGDGTADQGSGVIEEIIDLTGETMNGTFFVGADPGQDLVTNADLSVSLNFENDNVTFLLVSDLAAVLGTDLDTDDDGTLDSEPWGELLDAVSLVSSFSPTDVNDLVYAGTLTPAKPVVGPDNTFIPAHVYRSSANPSDWIIGTFFADSDDAADTPGLENDATVGPPSDDDIKILSFNLDTALNRATITATGLGSKVWIVQSSDDLGVLDAWEEVANSTESDNADGSVNFLFTASADSNQKQFYRLIEE